jgi:hypothetical protein
VPIVKPMLKFVQMSRTVVVVQFGITTQGPAVTP